MGAPRVELGGGGENNGRAGPMTRIARSASILMRLIGCKLERGVDRAEEQPATMLAADQIGMLALPTDPRRLAQRFLHDRRGIDEQLELGCRLGFNQPACQRFELLFQRIVIVAPFRIARDARLYRVALPGPWLR